MKMIKTLSILTLIGLTTVFGCRPRGAEYISDTDVVGTAYTKDANFSNKTSYYISDTIPQIDGDNTDKKEYVNASTSSLIVAQIVKNLNGNGWNRVADPNQAQMIMQVAGMKTTNIYYYYNSYYYGYYGWYYPGYYPPTYSTTQSGTILMQFIDKTDISISGKAPVLWVGVVNGLLEGSSTSISSRIVSTIDQSFKQSPILKK